MQHCFIKLDPPSGVTFADVKSTEDNSPSPRALRNTETMTSETGTQTPNKETTTESDEKETPTSAIPRNDPEGQTKKLKNPEPKTSKQPNGEKTY